MRRGAATGELLAPRPGGLALLGAALAAAGGAAHLGLLGYLFVKRAAYPFDLEWMEGGMLTHALRILSGEPLYAEPSADFIAFLYTPLYPYLLAALGKVAPVGYAAARVLSAACFAGTAWLLGAAVRRELGGGLWGLLWGVAAAGAAASAFPPGGAWFDLARNDSLYLLLAVGGLYLVRYGRGPWRGGAAAGLLLGLAFLAKQLAVLFAGAAGLALLVTRPRRVLPYGVAAALLAGGVSLHLQRATEGWYWRYIYQLHQGHDLYWDRMFPDTELRLLRAFPVVAGLLGLWLLVLLGGLLRRRRLTPADRGALYWFYVALAGVGVAAVGFATQWADKNAFIPGLVLPGAFAALACADIARRAGLARRPRAAGALTLLLAAALTVHFWRTAYDPADHLPSPRDRKNGDALIARLAAAPGPVLVPYHPFYPHLAGKPTHYHQMGVNDITRAGLPFPEAITQRVQETRYGLILLDNPPDLRYDFILARYKFARYFTGAEMPRVLTGFKVHPRYLFLPKRPEPPPAGARRVFGFESGSYEGWTVQGDAFGTRPAGGDSPNNGLAGPYAGAYLASSYTLGDYPTGRLLSEPFRVDRPRLTYLIGGGRDRERVYVRLLVEGKEVHRGTGVNNHIMKERSVDVRPYAGRKMQVEVVDDSADSWGHILFDEVLLRDR